MGVSGGGGGAGGVITSGVPAPLNPELKDEVQSPLYDESLSTKFLKRRLLCTNPQEISQNSLRMHQNIDS